VWKVHQASSRRFHLAHRPHRAALVHQAHLPHQALRALQAAPAHPALALRPQAALAHPALARLALALQAALALRPQAALAHQALALQAAPAHPHPAHLAALLPPALRPQALRPQAALRLPAHLAALLPPALPQALALALLESAKWSQGCSCVYVRTMSLVVQWVVWFGCGALLLTKMAVFVSVYNSNNQLS
jgi:hypothetical protein